MDSTHVRNEDCHECVTDLKRVEVGRVNVLVPTIDDCVDAVRQVV